MKRKYLRSCIALLLVFTVLCCGAVSASAYDSIYTINASDWTVPEGSGVLAFSYDGSSVGSNNDAYYCSVKSYNASVIEEINIDINSDDFEYSEFFMFRHYYGVYLINYEEPFCLAVDDDGYLYVECIEDSDTSYSFDIFTLVSPWQKWTKYVYRFGSGGYSKNEPIRLYDTPGHFPDYTTTSIYKYNADTGSIHGLADIEITGNSSTDFEYSYTLEKPLNLYSGFTTFMLQGEDINRFKYGTYAFSFDDVGCETLDDTFFACVDYELFVLPVNASDESDKVESSVLLEVPLIGNGFSTETVPADSLVLNDYVVYWQNNYLNAESSDMYAVGLIWHFYSEMLCRFYPGTINIIEYEAYESDMEHDEVMGAIDEAAASVTGSIDNAASELGQEIAQSATDIQSSINQSAAEIITSVDNVGDSIDNASSAITDKLSDVQEEVVDELQNVAGSVDDASNKLSDKLGEVKDGITNKLTEIKDNLLDGIKSFFIPSDEVMEEIDDKWDELLKTRFGALYEVSDIISDFANEMSWDYVRNAGVKNTITMPSVTVNLVGTDFTFGGYEVKVVPDGFDVLTTALKGITSIVCTLLFVNALRRKYDKLVGGSSA